MTALTGPDTASAPATRRRPPATVVAASILLTLIAVVGGYGAIYFTGLEGWDGIALCFVISYEFLAVSGLIAIAAFLAGHRLGRPGVIMYAVWMIYFTIFKVVTFHEVPAIPFGVVALVALFCATRTSARAYTR